MKKKFCPTCKDKKFCSIPCAELNSYLRSMHIRADNWGRNRHKEIPFGNLVELEHGLEQDRIGRKLPINLSQYDKNNE